MGRTMTDQSAKKIKASIEFEVIEGVGIDADSFQFTLDGNLIGCMDNFELKVDRSKKIGMLYFTQARPTEMSAEEEHQAHD